MVIYPVDSAMSNIITTRAWDTYCLEPANSTGCTTLRLGKDNSIALSEVGKGNCNP